MKKRTKFGAKYYNGKAPVWIVKLRDALLGVSVFLTTTVGGILVFKSDLSYSDEMLFSAVVCGVVAKLLDFFGEEEEKNGPNPENNQSHCT